MKLRRRGEVKYIHDILEEEDDVAADNNNNNEEENIVDNEVIR